MAVEVPSCHVQREVDGPLVGRNDEEERTPHALQDPTERAVEGLGKDEEVVHDKVVGRRTAWLELAHVELSWRLF